MSKADVGDFHTNFSSPTRCFSSRFKTRPENQNRNGPKNIKNCIFEKFLQGFQGVPGGSLGAPWGIYCTKTKPKAPGIQLLGSRRPILARKRRTKNKKQKKRGRPSLLKLRLRFLKFVETLISHLLIS